jgi:serine/threonine protein phosphatase PrpC
VTLDAVTISEAGQRPRNEDAVYADSGGVIVIADGVGGSPEGLRIATHAVTAAASRLEHLDRDLARELLYLPQLVGADLATLTPRLPATAATCLAAGKLVDNVLHMTATGDCRICVIRSARRHWRVISKVGNRRTGGDPAAVLRAGGIGGLDTPEVILARVADGDIVLATTDGIHSVLPDFVLTGLISQHADRSLDEICREIALLAMAIGSDNGSIAALRVPRGYSQRAGCSLNGPRPILTPWPQPADKEADT